MQIAGVRRYIKSDRMMYFVVPGATATPSCTILWKKHNARPCTACTVVITFSGCPVSLNRCKEATWQRGKGLPQKLRV